MSPFPSSSLRRRKWTQCPTNPLTLTFFTTDVTVSPGAEPAHGKGYRLDDKDGQEAVEPPDMLMDCIRFSLVPGYHPPRFGQTFQIIRLERMDATNFPRFVAAREMHHDRTLLPSAHFPELRGMQSDSLPIARVPQTLKIIFIREILHRAVQYRVQGILIRQKTLFRMFPDESRQPACHVMLPPIVQIDQ